MAFFAAECETGMLSVLGGRQRRQRGSCGFTQLVFQNLLSFFHVDFFLLPLVLFLAASVLDDSEQPLFLLFSVLAVVEDGVYRPDRNAEEKHTEHVLRIVPHLGECVVCTVAIKVKSKEKQSA